VTDTAKAISAMARLRNYFLTGFIVCAPLAITAYIAWSFIGWVDSWVKPYIPAKYDPDTYLPFPVPGFGLIVAIFLITMIGFLTANFIGRAIVNYGEYLLSRMPFVRSIYSTLKQIFETSCRTRPTCSPRSASSSIRARASGRSSSSPAKRTAKSTAS
jgi:uncharacterized membrane protein